MSDDLLITPGSRKLEIKDSSGNVDAKIETDASGNLLITNAGGDISIGDTSSDVFIGDGTNNVDIVFEQDGEIRGTSGVTLTLGASGSSVAMATDLSLGGNDLTNVNDITISGNLTVNGTTTTLDSTNTVIEDSIIELNSGLTGANSKDIGFIFERGTTGNNAGFVWDESADRFTVFTTTDTAASDTVDTSSVANFQAGSFYGNGANLTSLNASNISSGTLSADRLNTGSSGNWWSGNVVKVGTDGVSEVGKYLDFHNTDAGTSDFDTRLYSNATGELTINGAGRILTTADEGAGNGLDADTLDSQHGSYYTNASNIGSGTLNVSRLPVTSTPARATELSSSQDLNDLNSSSAGFYYQTANADTTGNNYPEGTAGSLIVQKSAGQATQLYQTYQSDTTKLYFRSNYTSGWGSWQRVFADNYHPNADTLTTARTIGGVSFNGSANINLPGVNIAGNQNTSGTAAGLSGTPNITVGTITSSSSNNRLDALSIGDDSDIYLYESLANVLTIRTGASGSYKYFTFQNDGNFNTGSGGISTGGTERITSGGNLTNIGTISSGAITSSGNITLSSDATQIKFTGTGGPFGLEFGDTENNPNFRIYYRTSPNTLTFEDNSESVKHTFDLSGNYTSAGDITSGDDVIVGDLLIMAGGDTKAIAFTGTGSDTNVRHFAYEASDHHYVTNRHTNGDLVLMSNNGTGGGETTRITLQSGSGTQDIDITNANLDMNSNNINNVGTISSGAITTTAPIKVLQPSSSTINELLVLEADDPNADIIMTDNTGSVRLRTSGNGDFVIFTGGSATSQNASGSTTALTIDQNQNATFAGEAFFNGTKLEGDSKEMIRFSDSWLRINPDNDFTSGIYCGTGLLRTDGTFQVGASGTKFAVNGANGNVTLAGTVDGRDIATDGTKLDTIATNADVTPSWVPSSDPSYATQSYVGTQISNLVDSAPGTLNTLNELAAALGDDANFSTTVTNSIATKLPLAGGTMTGDINMNSNDITNIKYLQFTNEEITDFTGAYQMLVDANDVDSDVPNHGNTAGSGPFGIYFTGDNGAATTTLGSGLVKVWHTGHFTKTHIDYFVGLYNTGVTTTEFDYLDGVTSNIQTQLDGKQASGSYLTGNQTITLSGDASGSGTTSINVTVADDSHNHIISNIDGLQTALDSKYESGNNVSLGTISSGAITSSSNVTAAGLVLNGSGNASYDTELKHITRGNGQAQDSAVDSTQDIYLAYHPSSYIDLTANQTYSSATEVSQTFTIGETSGSRWYAKVKMYDPQTANDPVVCVNDGTEHQLRYENAVNGSATDDSNIWTVVDITDDVVDGSNTIKVYLKSGQKAYFIALYVFSSGGLHLPNEPYELPVYSDQGFGVEDQLIITKARNIQNIENVDVTGDISSGTGSNSPNIIIDKSTTGTGSLLFKNAGNNKGKILLDSDESLNFYVNNTSLQLKMLEAGNVIIGGSSVFGSAKLTVDAGSGFAGIAVFDSAATNGGYIQLRANNSPKGSLGFGTNAGAAGINDMILSSVAGNVEIQATTLSKEIIFNTGGTDRMKVTANGNLQFLSQTTTIDSPGITYHTNNHLYVKGGSAGLILSDDGGQNTIQISDAGDYVRFETGDGTERVRINAAGLDIKTGSLYVNQYEAASATVGTKLFFGDHGDDLDVHIQGFSGGSTIYMADGSIYFNGTSNSTAGFKMIGNTGAFHSNGDVIAYSSTLTASDRRLKENVKALENPLEKVMHLQGVKYDWKDAEKGTNQIGLIAQEVEEIVPEVVNTIENGLGELNDMKVVNYSALVPMLIEAIKEQQTIINRLEERLNNLENKGEE